MEITRVLFRGQVFLCALIFVSIVAGHLVVSDLRAENAALKRDLSQVQARLDEFYGPAENTAKLNDMSFKAVPELGRNDVGYLVLDFSRIGFTSMCQAGFRVVAHDTWEKVGEPFLCPGFEPIR